MGGGGGQSDPKPVFSVIYSKTLVSFADERAPGGGEGGKERGREGGGERVTERGGGGCWNRKSESRPTVICLRDTTHIQLVLWTRCQDEGVVVLCPTCLCNQADLILSAF